MSLYCFNDCGKPATFKLSTRKPWVDGGRLGGTFLLAATCDEHLPRGVWELRHESGQADNEDIVITVRPVIEEAVEDY